MADFPGYQSVATGQLSTNLQGFPKTMLIGSIEEWIQPTLCPPLLRSKGQGLKRHQVTHAGAAKRANGPLILVSCASSVFGFCLAALTSTKRNGGSGTVLEDGEHLLLLLYLAATDGCPLPRYHSIGECARGKERTNWS